MRTLFHQVKAQKEKKIQRRMLPSVSNNDEMQELTKGVWWERFGVWGEVEPKGKWNGLKNRSLGPSPW